MIGVKERKRGRDMSCTVSLYHYTIPSIYCYPSDRPARNAPNMQHPRSVVVELVVLTKQRMGI